MRTDGIDWSCGPLAMSGLTAIHVRDSRPAVTSRVTARQPWALMQAIAAGFGVAAGPGVGDG